MSFGKYVLYIACVTWLLRYTGFIDPTAPNTESVPNFHS